MARPPTGQVVERQGRTGTTYAIRFRAYGDRHYVTTDAPTRADAEQELADTLVLVKRGLWRPPVKIEPELPAEPRTFHEFSSEWYERRRFEVGERTSEHWLWALSNHLLAPLGTVDVGAIGVEEVDSFKTTKLRERERYEAASEK